MTNEKLDANSPIGLVHRHIYIYKQNKYIFSDILVRK